MIGTSGVRLTLGQLLHGLDRLGLGDGDLVIHPSVLIYETYKHVDRADRVIEGRVCQWAGYLTDADPEIGVWLTEQAPQCNGGADWLGWYIIPGDRQRYGERVTLVVSRRDV